MRFLILSHLGDQTAMRVYAELNARYGIDQVSLVTSEELIFAPHWSHQLGEFPPHTEVQLHNRLQLISNEIGVVFNRLRYVFLPQFENASQENRDYAIMEVYALWLSWLASLPCHVINNASPRGMGANERSHVEWLNLAIQAGLRVQGYLFSTNPRRYYHPSYQIYKRVNPSGSADGPIFQEIPAHTAGQSPAVYLEPVNNVNSNVLIAGEQVVGPLAVEFSKELKMLTRLSACDLLLISFAPKLSINSDFESPANEVQNWRVSHVTAFPRVEDTASILAIVAMLESASLGK